MTDPIIVALIAFCSAIIGGLVQSWMTSIRERRAFRWSLNRENYSLFMQAIAQKATYVSPGPQRTEAHRLQIEATAKILLQGSPDVVNALNQFQSHAAISSEEGYRDFGRLVAAMRKDVGGKHITDFVAIARSTLFTR